MEIVPADVNVLGMLLSSTILFSLIIVLMLCLCWEKSEDRVSKDASTHRVSQNGTMGTINLSFETKNETAVVETPKVKEVSNDEVQECVDSHAGNIDDVSANQQHVYENVSSEVNNLSSKPNKLQQIVNSELPCSNSSDSDWCDVKEAANKQFQTTNNRYSSLRKTLPAQKKRIYNSTVSRNPSVASYKSSRMGSMRRIRTRKGKTSSNESLEGSFRALETDFSPQYENVFTESERYGSHRTIRKTGSIRHHPHAKVDMEWAERNHLTSNKKSKRKSKKKVPLHFKPVEGLPAANGDFGLDHGQERHNSRHSEKSRRRSLHNRPSSIQRTPKPRHRKLSLDPKTFWKINEKNRISKEDDSPSFFISFDNLTPPDSPATVGTPVSLQKIISSDFVDSLVSATSDEDEELSHNTLNSVKSERKETAFTQQPSQMSPGKSDKSAGLDPTAIYAKVNKAKKTAGRVLAMKNIFESKGFQEPPPLQIPRSKRVHMKSEWVYMRESEDKNHVKIKPEEEEEEEEVDFVLPMSPEQRRRRYGKPSVRNSPFVENVKLGKIVNGYIIPVSQQSPYMDFTQRHYTTDGNSPTTIIRTEKLKHTQKLKRKNMRTYTSNSLRRLDNRGLQYQGEIPLNRFRVTPRK